MSPSGTSSRISADATTGKRLKRLTSSTLNPEFEELRYAYSQSAFSPDGKLLAYTSYRRGKDVIDILDIKSKDVIMRLDTPEGDQGFSDPSITDNDIPF